MNLKLHTVVNVKPVYFTEITIMILIVSITAIIGWGVFFNDIIRSIIFALIDGVIVVFTVDPSNTFDFGEDVTITDTQIILGDKSYDRIQMNTLTVKIEGYKDMFSGSSRFTITGINNYLEVGFRNGEELNVRLYLETKEEMKELSDFYRSYYR